MIGVSRKSSEKMYKKNVTGNEITIVYYNLVSLCIVNRSFNKLQ